MPSAVILLMSSVAVIRILVWIYTLYKSELISSWEKGDFGMGISHSKD
jgi:hypothetical protein